MTTETHSDLITFENPTPEQLAEETSIPIAVFFSYHHLPPFLAAVSAPFAALAGHVVATQPRSPERTVALRKILEGKDAAVRCAHLAELQRRRAESAERMKTDPRDPEPMLPDNSQAVETNQRRVAAMSDPDRDK